MKSQQIASLRKPTGIKKEITYVTAKNKIHTHER